MFTGIIEEQGQIDRLDISKEGAQIFLRASLVLDGLKTGDSVAINGVCLTATKINNIGFETDITLETLSKTNFSYLKKGSIVNLERALQVNGRLDGHIVSGHIDGLGIIKSQKQKGNAIIIAIEVSDEIAKYIIKKGSIAVDGISLTVNKCLGNVFSLSIIPHTLKLTSLNNKNIGDKVNIETDMIGKYIENFVNQPTKNKENKINKDFLGKFGFI